MKYLLSSLIAMLFALSLQAQLTPELCYEKAKAIYPLIKQNDLIEQVKEYTLANAGKGYLPQVTLMAKATYQSDVTEIPIKLPNMTIDPMTKDQYQVVAEVNQTIWDGGQISAMKRSAVAAAEADKLKTETDLYTLKERINQLYFGSLLINEQLTQLQLLQKELQVNINRVEALKNNGMANQTDVNTIKVEQLKAEQQQAELNAMQKSYLSMLSAMTGEQISSASVLTKPSLNTTNPKEIKRPELSLFDSQSNLLAEKKSSITASTRPRLGVYIQGGYGKPGLNMLKSEFSEFYIAGLRLNWNLSNFYTQKNNLNMIELNQKMIEAQKETFLFNTSLKTTQQQTEIEKLQTLLRQDDEIIALRSSIKKAAETRVENGTLTTSDLIREINAESMAMQAKALHEIQLLMAIYNLKYITNN